MYVCTYLCAGVHDRSGGQRSRSGVFLNHSTFLSEVGLLAIQEFINLTRLAGPQALDPSVFIPHPTLALGFVCCHTQLFIWMVGGSELRPSCLVECLPGMHTRSTLLLFGKVIIWLVVLDPCPETHKQGTVATPVISVLGKWRQGDQKLKASERSVLQTQNYLWSWVWIYIYRDKSKRSKSPRES